MKIVLWGTYDTGKPRVRILLDGLRQNGAQVIEIHADIWNDLSDKSSLHGVHKWVARGLKVLGTYPILLWRYLHAPEHDLVLVSYPAQLDVLVLRPFAWLRRKPLALDWFISAFDTVVNDRQLVKPTNPVAWILWCGEWLAAHAADIAFMDTATHARYMERLFRLGPNSVGRVWVGAEAPFFQTDDRDPCQRVDAMQILFYGQFIPLHGISTIIQAAGLTRDEPINWTLVGRGQDAEHVRDLLSADPLSNIEWIDWLDYTALPDAIACADICLGIFGNSTKAASVIPNKVFQIIASRRALITRDSEAIRELLGTDQTTVQLVSASDAKALANAIRDHLYNPTRYRNAGDYHGLAQRITPAAIARQFEKMIVDRLHNGANIS